MPLTPFFTVENTKPAFECRFHFCWPTYRRKPLFADPNTQAVLGRSFADLTVRYDYHVLESAFEPFVFRALLSLKPCHKPAEVTRIVKGNLAAAARKQLGQSELWSRGSFVRSVGHVNDEAVRRYIAGQYEHHAAMPVENPAYAMRAKFHHLGPCDELRRSDHAIFEYNVHIVFVTSWRRECLSLDVAESLVQYWRSVCEQKQWITWDVEVVWDHAHLFLGLRPVDAPGEVALSLLNNSENFLEPRVLADMNAPTVWRPGYYAGTVGAATTAQVKAFLERERV